MRPIASLAAVAPGLLLCAAIGGIVMFAASRFGGSALLYALLIGMAVHRLTVNARFAPGVGFASRTVLQVGVALLGVQIAFGQILATGIAPIAIVLVMVPMTIAFGMWLSRRMGMTKSQGVLSGGAVAICGASAALAIAAVLPRREHSERHLIFTIVGVTTLSTAAMVLYPLIVTLLDMPDARAGFFLGGTIHNVPQAVGAGYMISDTAGDTATLIKLLRVAMLAPVVLIISVTVARGGHASSGGASLPGFLVAFAALLLLNGFGLIPETVRAPLETVSRACLVVAIAAIGAKTSFRELAESGWRPMLLITSETLFLAGLVLAGLHFLH